MNIIFDFLSMDENKNLILCNKTINSFYKKRFKYINIQGKKVNIYY